MGDRAGKYADLYPLMVPELAGCPDPMILASLQRSTRRFCMDTGAWMEQLQGVNLVKGVLTYGIMPSWDAEILRVCEVRINTEDGIAEGNVGTLIDPDAYTFYRSDSWYAGERIPAVSIRLDDSLEPSVDVAKGLEVRVSLMPYILASSMDIEFLNRWAEAIVGGAMADLMSMEKKPWSNPKRSGWHMSQYQTGWNRAKVELDGCEKDEQSSVGA